MPRHCPECGADMRKDGCSNCNHGHKAKSANTDAESWRCVHAIGGQRCQNPGTIKANGPGGFYCAEHRPILPLMVEGVIVAPPMGFDGLRAQIKRLKPHDFEADAERMAMQAEPPA